MRIGIDARMYSSQFTGIGRYVYELTDRLFKIDRANEYVLFMNDPQYSLFKTSYSNVTKIIVNARHYSLSEQTHFLKKLLDAKLDLMHFTHFNAPLLYNKPSIVTIHDLTLSFFPGKKMRRWYHRLAYQAVIRRSVHRAKKIIAVSENTKKDLMKLLKTSPKNIQVIYEGVGKEFKKIEDPKQLQDVQIKHKITEPFLLYTGVWRSHKNLVNLLKAFAVLIHKKNFQGQLVLTGREDPFYPEVKETIRDLNLKNKVILTGLVDEKDLIALYNAARLYVLPSLYEGFGLSPLEAMACGTPVIASNASCIPEVCGEKNAIFFDPHNFLDIAEKILETWTNPLLQKNLQKRGLERVKYFSWDKMAQETLKQYTL